MKEAFDMRQRSDYSAGHIVLKEDVEEILKRASVFVKGIKEKLRKKTESAEP